MRETITVLVDSPTLERARARAALGDTPLTTLVGEVVQTWLEAYLAQPAPVQNEDVPPMQSDGRDPGQTICRDKLHGW